MATEVIIISGTFAPPLGNNFYPYSSLVKLFESAGYKVHLETIRLLGIGRMESSLEKIEQKYFQKNDSNYILLGHSQGGLLALSLASEYSYRVESVEIFGSPLYGTRLAPMWFPFPAIRAMNYRSRWLKQLREHENLNAQKVHSYFSALDTMVVPWIASMLKDGNNHLLVPKRIEGVVKNTAKLLVGDRIDGVDIIHGCGGHLAIVSHPAVLASIASRY
jgi:pimeloyl-ACP methyl ester carboxylesterase